MRRAVRGQYAKQARIRKPLYRPLERGETGAAVSGKRGRMVERASVDVNSHNFRPPCAADRFGEEPAAVSFAGEFGGEADESQLALPRLAKVELHDSDVLTGLISHREQSDAGVADDTGKLGFIHHQPREPKPRSANAPEQFAIGFGAGRMDVL